MRSCIPLATFFCIFKHFFSAYSIKHYNFFAQILAILASKSSYKGATFLSMVVSQCIKKECHASVWFLCIMILDNETTATVTEHIARKTSAGQNWFPSFLFCRLDPTVSNSRNMPGPVWKTHMMVAVSRKINIFLSFFIGPKDSHLPYLRNIVICVYITDY